MLSEDELLARVAKHDGEKLASRDRTIAELGASNARLLDEYADAREMAERFNDLTEALIALMPDEYDGDEAVEALILRWVKEQCAVVEAAKAWRASMAAVTPHNLSIEERALIAAVDALSTSQRDRQEASDGA